MSNFQFVNLTSSVEVTSTQTSVRSDRCTVSDTLLHRLPPSTNIVGVGARQCSFQLVYRRKHE